MAAQQWEKTLRRQIKDNHGFGWNLIEQSGKTKLTRVHLCNMGGELVSVEGLSDSLGQPVDLGLLNKARWHTTEAWISLQRMITMG